MNWDQLKEMSDAGFSIQSHTESHRPLSELNNKEIMQELQGSKRTLEDHLRTQVDFLSLPHGIVNKRVWENIRDARYIGVCSSDPGFFHGYEKGIPMFKRINVSNWFDIDEFRKILEMSPVMAMSLIASKKIKNLVKKTMGYSTYRKLYKLRYQIKD
jgi:peptidoglycan/xylan/chitin deacetylase (PgdA/CDA1 family)